MSIDVLYYETTPFLYASPISKSQGKKNEWLVYQITRALTEQLDDVALRSSSSSIEHQLTIVPPTLALSTLARPSIVQV